MARVGDTKKKKNPRATELSQLKKKLQRVAELLESRERELAEATEQQTATSDILRMIAGAGTNLQSRPRAPALQPWARSMLAVPLLREGVAIGTITI